MSAVALRLQIAQWGQNGTGKFTVRLPRDAPGDRDRFRSAPGHHFFRFLMDFDRLFKDFLNFGYQFRLGNCKDLPGICQEPAGQRLHLDTVLAYTRLVISTRPQTAITQNGGAAVTGLWPPSIKSAPCPPAHQCVLEVAPFAS